MKGKASICINRQNKDYHNVPIGDGPLESYKKN